MILSHNYHWCVLYDININKFSHDYKDIEDSKQKNHGGTLTGIIRRLDYLKQLNVSAIHLFDPIPYKHSIAEICKHFHSSQMSVFANFPTTHIPTLQEIQRYGLDGIFIKDIFSTSLTDFSKSIEKINKSCLICADDNFSKKSNDSSNSFFFNCLRSMYNFGLKYVAQETAQLSLSWYVDGVVDYAGAYIAKKIAQQKGIFMWLPEYFSSLLYGLHTNLYPSKTVLITPIKRGIWSKDALTLVSRYSNPVMIQMGVELGQTNKEEPLKWSLADSEIKSKEMFYYCMKLFETRKDTSLGIPTIFTMKQEFLID
ncbi:Uncharacterized protein QTN25_010628 [Entamoeba marina]